MRLKMIWFCLAAVLMAGCKTTDQGMVLCRSAEIMQNDEGAIISHPFKTTQTKFKAGEVPTLYAYGYGGKHVRVEVVNAAGQVIQHLEGDVRANKWEKHENDGFRMVDSDGYQGGGIQRVNSIGLRRT